MSGPLNRTVLWLTWRQLFSGRRVWFALAFALAPLAFTLAFRLVADDGDASRVVFYQGVSREIALGVLLPLAGVVFGSTAFGGEVDDGTLVYLLVKPVPRWALVLSKFAVATLSTLAIGVVALTLPWLALRNPALPLNMLTAFLIAAAVASAIYVALFLSLGLTTKRALVAGLIYVILFEGVISRNLQGLRVFSVREYALAVAQAASNGTIVMPGAVTMSTVRWMGTIMFLGAMIWTLRKLLRYEVAERL